MFGMEDLTEPQGQSEVTISYFMLSLLQIADQSKILHWQTDYDTEHRHFGLFYETFIDQMDTLIEAIAGKYGKHNLKFGEASIAVGDYELNRDSFFKQVDYIFRETFSQLFDREADSELYNLADEILDTKNKVQYLLQLR